MANTLELHALRELTLGSHTHTPGQQHVSAASGLVCAHGRAYVVADDELHLAVFRGATAPGRLVRLFGHSAEGQLPRNPAKRKRRKPDGETLALVPATHAWPHGALLALGSGSKPQRCQAAWLPLGAGGVLLQAPRTLDLAPLYADLGRRFDELNIEGAFFHGEAFVLLQRGNRGGSPNAVIQYRAAAVLAWMQGQAGVPRPVHVAEQLLGKLARVPLTFTDGTALDAEHWIFTAVAEATDDSVADGACVGAVVGIMSRNRNRSRQFELQTMRALPAGVKAEGVAARVVDGELWLCLVTDADDSRVPSRLWRARWPAPHKPK